MPRRPRASGGESEAFPTGLTLSEAYSVLGLKEDATYESVLAAKKRLLDRTGGDKDKEMEIEIAYDIIFSSQLKARLSGDLAVSNRVRFADVGPPRRAAPQKPIELPVAGVQVRQLPVQQTATTAVVFSVLAAWTLAQGLFEPTPAAAAADVPGLQLALGTAAAVYLLRENKRVSLPKAAGLAVGGLVLGTMIGSGLESWLRVDIVPIGNFSSPGILVGEFALLGLWAATAFLA